LRILDRAGQDVGSLLNWTLSLPSYSAANPVCGPFTSTPTPVTITNYTPVSAGSPGNTTFCPGGSTNLVSSYSTGNLWSTGATTQGISVSNAGTYSVTHTSPEGCTSIGYVSTFLFPAPSVTVSPDAAICPGTSVTLTAAGADTYVWTPGTGLNTNNGSTVIASPTSGTTYQVTGTDGNGCQASASVNVSIQSCAPATKISSAYCGRTNYHLTSSIVADLVSGATQYEFQFKDAADINVVATVLQTSRTLNLSNVNPSLQWNTNYVVRVRAFIGTQSGVFGTPCNIGFIQNPAITNPTTQLRSTDCNKMNCLLTTSIQANQVPGASLYVFEFRDLNNNLVATRSIANYFTTLSAVTPALSWNTIYNVRVRVNIGSWQGAFGNVCQIGILPDPATVPVPTTQLTNATCGNTSLGLNQSGTASSVSGATQYEFEFRNPATGNIVATHIQTSPNIIWMNVIPALQWGTQYQVRVRAYVGTRIAEWGNTCLIGFIQDPILTGIGNTSLVASSCSNQNLSQIGTISCTSVSGANQYEFEFRSTGGVLYATRISSNTTCALSTLNPLLNWGTQYKVRVRAAISGIWGQFSTECTIGLVQDPAIFGVPNTQLRSQDCGRTNLSLSSSIIASSVTGASSYEFEFRESSNPLVTYANRIQASTTLNLSVISPALQAGTTYEVRVRAKIGNVWGNFGNACLISLASGSRYDSSNESDNSSEQSTAPLSIVPNPSMDAFRFSNPNNGDPILFEIFDLSGKLIEVGNLSDGESLNLGHDYAPGVYILRAIHKSGDQENFRLIKQ
jgi:hypothetical protein